MHRYVLVLMLMPFTAVYSQAGQNDLGTWNILNARYQLGTQWSLFVETQVRSLGLYKRYHYHEVKGGVAYKVSEQITLLVGSGDYQTYQDAGGNFTTPKINHEFRIWSQLSLNNYWKRLRVENRYRYENRWTSSSGYRNRFRYRIQFQIPINEPKIQPKTLYWVAWNEIFLTNRAPFFERNRVFVGFGYEISNHVATQIGMLNQYDYGGSKTVNKNFLQISLLFNFKRKRQEKYQNLQSPDQ